MTFIHSFSLSCLFLLLTFLSLLLFLCLFPLCFHYYLLMTFITFTLISPSLLYPTCHIHSISPCFLSAVDHRFRANLSRCKQIMGKSLLVAYSGGSASTALLAALEAFCTPTLPHESPRFHSIFICHVLEDPVCPTFCLLLVLLLGQHASLA